MNWLYIITICVGIGVGLLLGLFLDKIDIFYSCPRCHENKILKNENKVAINFKQDSIDRINKLIKKTESNNPTEVILKALRLYEHFVNECTDDQQGKVCEILKV